MNNTDKYNDIINLPHHVSPDRRQMSMIDRAAQFSPFAALTGHSEAIVTEDTAAAKKFMMAVDSSSVYHNASTRFTDGGEFGLGCEMGISTQKLHARGPLGIKELTTYKYIIHGDGQVR